MLSTGVDGTPMHKTYITSCANDLGRLRCRNDVSEDLRIIFCWRPVPLIFVRVIYVPPACVSRASLQTATR